MSMNRLKFRVWDKMENRFIYSDRGYQGHYVLTLKGEFYNLQNGSCGNEYVVQQWTGLQDKNGVDIYEGDIIEIFNHIRPENVEYVAEGSCGFGFWLHDLNGDGGFELLGDWTGPDGYEVIGTIFKNEI